MKRQEPHHEARDIKIEIMEKLGQTKCKEDQKEINNLK